MGKPREPGRLKASQEVCVGYFSGMEPKDILAISGKPGLYKVLNTTQRAIVVEPLGSGKRTAVPSSARVSSFEDISIFTYEEDLPLSGVLNTMFELLKGQEAPSSKSTHDELREFVTQVVPELDQERVYHSDLKKLCSWYNALVSLSLLPFGEAAEEPAEEGEPAEHASSEGESAEPVVEEETETAESEEETGEA